MKVKQNKVCTKIIRRSLSNIIDEEGLSMEERANKIDKNRKALLNQFNISVEEFVECSISEDKENIEFSINLLYSTHKFNINSIKKIFMCIFLQLSIIFVLACGATSNIVSRPQLVSAIVFNFIILLFELLLVFLVKGILDKNKKKINTMQELLKYCND